MTSVLSARARLATSTFDRSASRRTSSPSAVERLSAALLGSPSARRANGGAETSFVPRALRTKAWFDRRANAPVYAVDRRGSAANERLPRIWITERVLDERTGDVLGRSFVGVYPSGADADGARALEYASRYFGEALSCEGSSEAALRVECFRAAEVLYLHAARRGSSEACVKLSVIYRRDLCEGVYWRDLLSQRAAHARVETLDERARALLVQAAADGCAEACWRLGDLLLEGGTEYGAVDAGRRAFALYRHAYHLSCARREPEGERSARGSSCDVAGAGRAALGMARCYERGCGVVQSFETARSWYGIAARFLEEAVEVGAWRCKRDLCHARTGVACMAQEIGGELVAPGRLRVGTA